MLKKKCQHQEKAARKRFLKKYSGRFMVRIPSMVHRTFATEAAEQGVSINQLVAAKLAL